MSRPGGGTARSPVRAARTRAVERVILPEAVRSAAAPVSRRGPGSQGPATCRRTGASYAMKTRTAPRAALIAAATALAVSALPAVAKPPDPAGFASLGYLTYGSTHTATTDKLWATGPASFGDGTLLTPTTYAYSYDISDDGDTLVVAGQSRALTVAEAQHHLRHAARRAQRPHHHDHVDRDGVRLQPGHLARRPLRLLARLGQALEVRRDRQDHGDRRLHQLRAGRRRGRRTPRGSRRSARPPRSSTRRSPAAPSSPAASRSAASTASAPTSRTRPRSRRARRTRSARPSCSRPTRRSRSTCGSVARPDRHVVGLAASARRRPQQDPGIDAQYDLGTDGANWYAFQDLVGGTRRRPRARRRSRPARAQDFPLGTGTTRYVPSVATPPVAAADLIASVANRATATSYLFLSQERRAHRHEGDVRQPRGVPHRLDRHPGADVKAQIPLRQAELLDRRRRDLVTSRPRPVRGQQAPHLATGAPFGNGYTAGFTRNTWFQWCFQGDAYVNNDCTVTKKITVNPKVTSVGTQKLGTTSVSTGARRPDGGTAVLSRFVSGKWVAFATAPVQLDRHLQLRLPQAGPRLLQGGREGRRLWGSGLKQFSI